MKDHGIFEGERAQKYDQFTKSWIPAYDSLLHSLPDLLSSKMSADENKVLVAGCGTGKELLPLAKMKQHWHFTGVDPSPEMLEQAREKLASFSNVKLLEAYVSDLPQSDVFQAATLLLVSHFLPDDGTKLTLLQDISERLSSGAPFVMAGIFGSSQEVQLNLQVLRTLLPPDLDPERVNERIDHIYNNIQYVSENRLTELLVEAGFVPPIRFFQMAIWGGWITQKK
ncbi:MAG: class I SAM-dependent methyltransferase [Bacteroidota bacterium]